MTPAGDRGDLPPDEGSGDDELPIGEQSTDEVFAVENLLGDLDGEGQTEDPGNHGEDPSDPGDPGGDGGLDDDPGSGGAREVDTDEFDSLVEQALEFESGDEPAEGEPGAAGDEPGGGKPRAAINAPGNESGQQEPEQERPEERPADTGEQPVDAEQQPAGAAAGPDTDEQPGIVAEDGGDDAGAEGEEIAEGAGDSGDTEAMEPVSAGAPSPDATGAAAAAAPRSFGPFGENDHEPPPRRPRIFLSFFLAAVLIIGTVAGASSATVIMYLDEVASDLRENSLDVGGAIVPTSSGEPQTILLLGSDRRASDADGEPALSDTAMLLRLDPDRDEIAVMSIPRDLRVEIPGHGIDKFNAAYAYGGPELTLRTVRRLTGGIDINHVVNIDFVGFIRVVDEINCIYINVDRRYFNSNEGVPAHLQYAEIDIEPGYQKLCGEDALDYARYRHDDNDLVRAARQQEVIRAARNRMPISKLISDRDRLIEIFTDYTTSDITETGQIIELLNLAIDARNASIKEIHFPGVAQAVEPGQPAYVIAEPADVREAVDRFLGFEATGGPRGSLDRDQARDRTGERRTARQRRKQQRQERRERRESINRAIRGEADGLVDASTGARDVALGAASELGPSLPVFYPRQLPSGAIFVEEPRVYHVRDLDGESHGAYTVVMQLSQGDYFNVQGIRGWSDPPILEAPHETIEIGDHELEVYLDGDRIRLIAWHVGPNTYWISNSLLLTLSKDQMLGMARTMGVVVPDRKTRAEKLEIIAERE